MKIAYPYERKSPDDKENTDRSIENQRELIKNTCIGKEWKLVDKNFSDKNITGSDRSRKGLNQCMTEARKYKILNPKDDVYIIVKEQDRFARDSAFMKNTLKDLDAYGVKVFSIIKNDFLDADDLGDSVTSLMNEQLIVQGRKKAFILRDQKIEKKLPCIPAPFGYKYKNKQWVADNNNFKIVLNVINDYLNNISYKETLLNNKINRTKRDRIIFNAKKGLYNGIITFENKIKDSNKKVIRTEIIKYKGTYQHLLTEELFLRCQR